MTQQSPGPGWAAWGARPRPRGGGRQAAPGARMEAGMAVTLGPGFGELCGELSAGLRAQRERDEQWQALAADAHMVPIAAGQIALAAGAGTLDTGGAGQLGPMRGFYWDVRRLVAASFTGGSVTAYVNQVQDANIFVEWPQAGLYTFGRGEGVLNPQDRLVFVAAGITGAVTISGAAVQFTEQLLPWFLGLG